MVDLHTHSTCSDGSSSPEELASEAAAAGLSAIALTDHDTVTGIPQFLKGSAAAGVLGVPGVEISCQWHNNRRVHIVGLFVDVSCSSLAESLSKRREARNVRNREILRRLAAAGMRVSEADVLRFAAGEAVGRPHIARALVAQGLCPSIGEAFREFLGEGKRAYVPRVLPFPSEGIGVIHRAGGVAVLAHAFLDWRRPGSVARRLVMRLRTLGLDAIEVRWNSAGLPRPDWARVAANNELLLSGGSDYHGATKEWIGLGRGDRDSVIPDWVTDKLAERAQQQRERRQ